MDKLLYYPFMSIPKSDWLVQSLLYWDGIATIIPLKEQRNLRNITPFARNLIQDGLIESLSPEEYAYIHPDEYLEFLDWVTSNRSRFICDYNTIRNHQRVHISKLNNVNVGKLGFLGDEFVKMGVAYRQDSQWYVLNKDLSLYFMTFLAVLIGMETNYIPTTDQHKGLNYLLNLDTQSNNISNKANARFRSVILNKLLPVPSHIENYYDVYKFKEKHYDQLISFRRKIETFLVSLSEHTENEKCKLCDAFCEDAIEEIDDLKGKLGFFKAPRINLDTVFTASPAIYDFANNNVAEGCIGLIPVVFKMFYNDNRKRNLLNPLAYAAFVNNSFPNRR